MIPAAISPDHGPRIRRTKPNSTTTPASEKKADIDRTARSESPKKSTQIRSARKYRGGCVVLLTVFIDVMPADRATGRKQTGK